jgi:glycosyltransferase involved in cell wall biosynthesis
MRCLFSVLSSRQETPYSLMVVDDCSPDDALRAQLEALAAARLIELHRTPCNLGFVGACNLGMAINRDRDVVLLNSDTKVFGDWLDRLRDAALRRLRTGTVTPLSNNAEICSYPHFVQDNRQPLEIGDAQLDRLAAEANAGTDVEIPTGVGFCMYVRRSCLNEVGLFNEDAFGQGYGEENDFCLRAASAGWRNILAPNVFVYHYGAASFGASKRARAKVAIETVERLHPGYLQQVLAFVQADPVRPFREAIDIARLANRARCASMLFVTHRLGGGTERHVQDMARLLEADGFATVFCRVDPADPGLIKVEDPGVVETPNLPTFDVTRDIDQFARFLLRIRVGHVHVHHLAGFPESAPDFIRLACTAAGLAYDVTLHDYIPVCPRNLVDGSGVYCGEPELPDCERCIVREGSPYGRPSVWDWRGRYGRLLSEARRVFVPDGDVARRMGRFFPSVAYTVRPHPELADPRLVTYTERRGTQAKPGAYRRVAVMGAIAVQKGSIQLAETARVALRRRLPLEFVVVGYTDRDAELRTLSNITITGRYQEDEALERLISADPDLVWFPAVTPETYCYTLSTVFVAGVYPVAFDFGAIAMRIRETGWGELMSLEYMLDPERTAERLATMSIPKQPEGAARLSNLRSYAKPLTSYYELAGSALGRACETNTVLGINNPSTNQ